MTEEQLQRIKDEAEGEAKFAMLFAKPTSEGLQNLGSGAEMLMRVAFVNGARFGFRLAKEEKHDQVQGSPEKRVMVDGVGWVYLKTV